MGQLENLRLGELHGDLTILGFANHAEAGFDLRDLPEDAAEFLMIIHQKNRDSHPDLLRMFGE
jgi:hypothetical protein